jgi:hypothetical protein
MESDSRKEGVLQTVDKKASKKDKMRNTRRDEDTYRLSATQDENNIRTTKHKMRRR